MWHDYFTFAFQQLGYFFAARVLRVWRSSSFLWKKYIRNKRASPDPLYKSRNTHSQHFSFFLIIIFFVLQNLKMATKDKLFVIAYNMQVICARALSLNFIFVPQRVEKITFCVCVFWWFSTHTHMWWLGLSHHEVSLGDLLLSSNVFFCLCDKVCTALAST